MTQKIKCMRQRSVSRKQESVCMTKMSVSRTHELEYPCVQRLVLDTCGSVLSTLVSVVDTFVAYCSVLNTLRSVLDTLGSVFNTLDFFFVLGWCWCLWCKASGLGWPRFDHSGSAFEHFGKRARKRKGGKSEGGGVPSRGGWPKGTRCAAGACALPARGGSSYSFYSSKLSIVIYPIRLLWPLNPDPSKGFGVRGVGVQRP